MTKAATIDMTKAKSIHDFAREFLDEEGGLTGPAIERLKAAIRDSDELRTLIATDAIMAYAALHIQAQMRGDREAIWAGAARRADPNAPPPKSKTSVSALANGIRGSLMNFPLAGGVRLRDATREQVEAQASLYDSASRDMGHKARWLAAIAARVDPGQRVGEALTEDVIDALHGETSNA